ncbi:MAG: Ada metal-binding domain-containing protein [Acidobacteriota bacterium]
MSEGAQAAVWADLSFADKLERMNARDRAYDGRFITGVLTTGIYCLPSCPARKPKPQNVVFFATEAAALAAGLRACKRCRPDDFYAGRDRDFQRLASALAELEQDPESFPDVNALARHAGLKLSKLYSVARRSTGSTPSELIHARRIEVAKRLLSEGRVGATEAAYAVGYGSVSAFYARFRAATGSTPSAFARR